MTLKNIVRFSSPTASGTNFRGKYQHFGLNLFFKTSRSLNSVYKYERKRWEILILRAKIDWGSKKIQFLLQSSSNVNRNTVWKLKIFWGLKMHCQNIVDERCVQKEFLNRFLLNKVYFPTFANRYILNPFLNIPLCTKIILKRFLLNKVYFPIFANRYILNPFLNIPLWLQFLT